MACIREEGIGMRKACVLFIISTFFKTALILNQEILIHTKKARITPSSIQPSDGVEIKVPT